MPAGCGARKARARSACGPPSPSAAVATPPPRYSRSCRRPALHALPTPPPSSARARRRLVLLLSLGFFVVSTYLLTNRFPRLFVYVQIMAFVVEGSSLPWLFNGLRGPSARTIDFWMCAPSRTHAPAMHIRRRRRPGSAIHTRPLDNPVLPAAHLGLCTAAAAFTHGGDAPPVFTVNAPRPCRELLL